MKFGVTIESKNPADFTVENAQAIQSIGMTEVRLQFHADRMQPVEGGAIDFTESDRQIALAKQFGLRVVWPIQQCPDYALSPGASSMPDPAYMASFALAAAQRYVGQIQRYEVLNEEPSREKNAAFRTPLIYAHVFTAVLQALRQGGYTGNVATFGYTNYHSTTDITEWFNGLLALTIGLSAIGLHFYHAGEDPLIPLQGKPSITQVLQAIRATGTTLPIHLTEFGYRTHCDDQHPAPCNEVTPDEQAKYEGEILQALYTDYKKNKAMVYTLCPGSQVMSIYQDGSFLPAGTMFKNFIASH